MIILVHQASTLTRTGKRHTNHVLMGTGRKKAKGKNAIELNQVLLSTRAAVLTGRSHQVGMPSIAVDQASRGSA